MAGGAIDLPPRRTVAPAHDTWARLDNPAAGPPRASTSTNILIYKRYQIRIPNKIPV